MILLLLLFLLGRRRCLSAFCFRIGNGPRPRSVVRPPQRVPVCSKYNTTGRDVRGKVSQGHRRIQMPRVSKKVVVYDSSRSARSRARAYSTRLPTRERFILNGGRSLSLSLSIALLDTLEPGIYLRSKQIARSSSGTLVGISIIRVPSALETSLLDI